MTFISETALRKKWKYLRDNFVSEYNKQYNECTTSKWAYFKPLLFLKPVITPRRTPKSDTTAHDDTESTSTDAYIENPDLTSELSVNFPTTESIGVKEEYKSSEEFPSTEDAAVSEHYKDFMRRNELTGQVEYHPQPRVRVKGMKRKNRQDDLYYQRRS